MLLLKNTESIIRGNIYRRQAINTFLLQKTPMDQLGGKLGK